MTHKVTPAARELYIGVMGPSGPNDQALIRSGHFDNTSVMQLLAGFEAETRMDERQRIARWHDEEGWAMDVDDIPDAIRDLTTGD